MQPVGEKLKKNFPVGSRVHVSALCAGWRNDFTGVVCSEPEPVQTMQGQDHFYWVQFDSDQHDLSQDGPYYKGQILGPCLTLVQTAQSVG